MNEPSVLDNAVDVPAMLLETETAIAALTQMNVPIPAEAMQLLAVLRRCVAAERELEALKNLQNERNRTHV
jgi:hypothetical protein